MKPDVVIVGAGPSGAVTAKRLIESGYSVVVLERGGWPDYSETRALEPDFELNPGKAWNPLVNTRMMPGDQAIDETNAEINSLTWNGVGGSAVLYAGQWHRSMRSDFRTRTLEGVGDDWPMTYEELVPFYQRIEREVGISGLNGDPAYPGTDYPMAAVRMREWGKRVAAAQDKLGWHWWPGSNAIATRPYRRLGANTELGTERWGSPDNSKGTFDVTHWPELIERGVDLRIRSFVSKVEVDDQGLATGVLYFDENGVEQRQEAGVVILAANGIGTPWLLLSSKSPRFPDGLANSSGMVGKRLMMHPLGAILGVWDDDLGTEQAAFGQQLYSNQFYETDESRGFVRGAKWSLVITGGPIAVTQPYPFSDTSFWGEDFHKTVRERSGRTAMWGIISEDLPEESNRVTLSADTLDQYGMAIPKLDYTVSENSSALLDWHEQRATESMEAAGARAVVTPRIKEVGWHLLGTARMGTDPATSVTNGFGQTHDVPNLYVFDGSLFPTSTGVNPTATIVALALRNTEALIANRSEQKTHS